MHIISDQKHWIQKCNYYLKIKLDELQPCADYLQTVVDSSSNFDSIELTRTKYLERFRNLLESFGSDSEKQSKLIELRKAYLIDKTNRFIDDINKTKARKTTKWIQKNVIN